MVKGIAEFLEEIGRFKKRNEKVFAIRNNDSKQLRIILQGIYDPDVKWALPPGAPPYTPNALVDQEHVLIKDVEKLKYFIEAFYPTLKQAKREAMFIEMLERVSPKDAHLLVHHLKEKKPLPGLPLDLIVEALPNMIPNSNVKIEA